MRTNRKVDSRRGSALVLALGAAIPLLVAGGMLLTAVTRQRAAAEHSFVTTRARDASASGAQDALARLAGDPNYTGTYELDFGGPIAQVEIAEWLGDGLDNDNNGTVDDADEEDFVAVSVFGAANVVFDGKGNPLNLQTRQGRSTTDVIVRRTDLDLLAEQAVYVDDPLASFKFSGAAFAISGNDTNIDGTAGPDSPLPGIGTPGDPAWITDQLKAAQKPLVTGYGGSPSIHTVADVDMMTQIDMLRGLASLQWSNPDMSYSGDIGDRTNLVPVIAHASGDLKLNGNTQGCGILIVDGDLVVNGTFDFVGFIFSAGGVTFNGGGGGKNLLGALFTLGAVDATDVTVNGSVQLKYSSEAIALVNTQLAGGIELVSWTQR